MPESNPAIPKIDGVTFWRMLELVADNDCDPDTGVLSQALDQIANGSPDEREEGIRAIKDEMARWLPDESESARSQLQPE